MAINAIGSTTSEASKTVQQPKPQQTEARKPETSGSADEAAKARQAQQAQASKSGPAKPVVNAEGQKTGQIISVTA